MAIHGIKWPCMALHGTSQWYCLLCCTILGNTWNHMAIHGNTWQYMVIDSKTGQYMAIHGNT